MRGRSLTVCCDRYSSNCGPLCWRLRRHLGWAGLILAAVVGSAPLPQEIQRLLRLLPCRGMFPNLLTRLPKTSAHWQCGCRNCEFSRHCYLNRRILAKLIYQWVYGYRYLDRLYAHCSRLGISPPKDFMNQLVLALRKMELAKPSTAPLGQGLFRLEITEKGSLSLTCRILPHMQTRTGLSAVTVQAPWWDQQDALGAKHGAWGPYLDAMRLSRYGCICSYRRTCRHK